MHGTGCLRASRVPHRNHSLQAFLLMEAAISNNDDQLVQVMGATNPQGAHPGSLQHVLHGCQQLHHWAVSYCVVLHS